MCAVCKGCGEEIIYRRINGVDVPISYTCRCDSGAFSSAGSMPMQSEDFCRATSCRICGKGVFFLRHNGGSVYLDELGWPWPKHGCFMERDAPSTLFGRELRVSSNSGLALINSAFWDYSNGQMFIFV